MGVITAPKDRTIVVAGNIYTNQMVKSQAVDNYHFVPKFEEIGFIENEDFPKLKAIIRKHLNLSEFSTIVVIKPKFEEENLPAVVLARGCHSEMQILEYFKSVWTNRRNGDNEVKFYLWVTKKMCKLCSNEVARVRESSGLDIKVFEPLEGTSNKDPKNWIACSGFEESVIRLGRDDGTNNNVKATIIPMVEEDLFSAAAD